MQVWTNTASQIRYRATANVAVNILATGWIDVRGQE